MEKKQDVLVVFHMDMKQLILQSTIGKETGKNLEKLGGNKNHKTTVKENLFTVVFLL
jgi:hypothetical protein